MNTQELVQDGTATMGRIGGRATAAAWRVLRELCRGWRVQGTVEALQRLDDATLRDIGMERAQLHDAARQAVARSVRRGWL